ncbi:hypothetical protein ACWDO6_28095 [Streptomyces sp. NPDC003674]
MQDLKLLPGNRIVRGQPVHLIDGFLAVLLHLHGVGIFFLVRRLLSRREVTGSLSVRRITRRHGPTYRREAHRSGCDLVACSSREGAQVMGARNESRAPSAEIVPCLADPGDSFELALELLGRGLDGVSRVPQGLTGGLKILWVGLLDQVDHLVEGPHVEFRAVNHGFAVRSRGRSCTNHTVYEPSEATRMRVLRRIPRKVREVVLRGNPIKVCLVFVGHRQNTP